MAARDGRRFPLTELPAAPAGISVRVPAGAAGHARGENLIAQEIAVRVDGAVGRARGRAAISCSARPKHRPCTD